MKTKQKKAIFAGSFDPITNGHLDIIKRAAKMFDVLYVCISINPEKKSLFTSEERIEFIRECTSELDNIKIVSYEGLLINYCHENEIDVLVRGIRGTADTEYELQMAYMNKKLDSNIETIILPTATQYSFVSSSLMKQVLSFGGDIQELVSPVVLKALKRKIEEERN